MELVTASDGLAKSSEECGVGKSQFLEGLPIFRLDDFKQIKDGVEHVR